MVHRHAAINNRNANGNGWERRLGWLWCMLWAIVLLAGAAGRPAAADGVISAAGYTITGPGTYTLDQDIVSSVAEVIHVESGSLGAVIINLNGHSISAGTSGNGYGIRVYRSSNVTITGNGGSVAGFNRGIMVTESTGCSVMGVAAQNCLYGIELDLGGGHTVSNCRVYGSNLTNSEGIRLSEGTQDPVIQSNAVQGCFLGIAVHSDSGQGHFLGNMVDSCEYGIWLDPATSGNMISGGYSSNNRYYGIRLDRANGNQVQDVQISGNGDTGILIAGGSNGNTITGGSSNNNTGYGIVLANATGNTVQDVQISGNGDTGIYLSSIYTSGNIITRNTVVNNHLSGCRCPGYDAFDANGDCTHNTWSDNTIGTASPRCINNHPPVADNQSITIPWGTVTLIGLTASDPDGDPLTYSVVTPPAHGTLQGTPPNLGYVSNVDPYFGPYIGPDQFTFKVNDGVADSNVATVSISVGKKPVTITLSNLNQTYTGSPRIATATTTPSGVTGVMLSYSQNGAPVAAPTNAGSYAVVASLNDPLYEAADATGILVINAAPASVSLSNLSQTYDGSPKAATVQTTPGGVGYSISYSQNGSPVSNPTNAGSYTVVATITDPNYTGSPATDTLVIQKGQASLSLGSLSQVYDGSPKAATSATSPSGLAGVSISYSRGGVPVSSPTNAGSYDVVASLTDPNYNAPNATGTLVIGKAMAQIVLGNLNATYDGTAKPASVLTTPAGLNVSVTYDGSSTAPVNAGSYAVVATVDDVNYQGTATNTLVIARADQTISFGPLADKTYGTAPFAISASASTGLPVSFSIVSGPATISGSTVTLTGVGVVVVRASQTGSANYNAAPNVDQSFQVKSPTQRILDAIQTAENQVNAIVAQNLLPAPVGVAIDAELEKAKQAVSQTTVTLAQLTFAQGQVKLAIAQLDAVLTLGAGHLTPVQIQALGALRSNLQAILVALGG